MSHVNRESYTPRSDSPIGRMLSLIEYKDLPLRFLILDCPTDSTLSFYLQEFTRLNVTDVVRVCEPTYSTHLLNELNIQVHDWPFKDGGVPPQHVVRDWLALVEMRQREAKMNASASQDDPDCRPTIAVHCVAGLGRAPALVAIALIEMGMQPLDAIEYIRRKRRGAFNNRQIMYIDSYKRTMKSSGSTSFKSSLGKMFKLGGKKVELAH